MGNKREYQICKRCVMDTTDPDIIFDENGYCNHCTNAIKLLEKINYFETEIKSQKLKTFVKKIKSETKNKKYNCVIGLSGGVDSSYLAYKVKELGLKPLAVHVDNGWNSELAVMNIENLVTKLDIDLVTYVIDWEEFKDLQISYLKASVIDIEVLSDNAIAVGIRKLQKKFDVKYFLSGTNAAAESIMPVSWYYPIKFDTLNIRSIYNAYGNKLKLKSYPLFSLPHYLKARYFSKNVNIPLLNYIDYIKEDALNILSKEIEWRDYGGKHYESKITQIYQAYILPIKFNVDKRKAHLSSLICSRQITREQALETLKLPVYNKRKLNEDIEYLMKKLELNKPEFDIIMSLPPKSHFDYPAFEKYHKKLSLFYKRVIKLI